VPEIVITEFMDDDAVAALRTRFDTLYDKGLADDASRLRDNVASARALIVRNRTQVTAGLLAAAPRLSCVGRLGVGLDNIDVSACAARGVAVYPATGANSLSVAEYVVAAILMLLRRSFWATNDVIAGRWPREKSIGGEMSGRTLGLIGFGGIAQEVARRAHAMGMHLVAFDPLLETLPSGFQYVRKASFEDLVTNADVVSLHVPITPDSRHMIDARAIARMKTGAIIINTARGGVVDDDALAAALRAGKLGGAALDVFEQEPLSELEGAKFAGISNLLLTPHIGGVTVESNLRVSKTIADKVAEHLARA